MQKSIIQLWWFSLAFKIVAAMYLPLFNDEAYYWIWSKHLQLSYFDHPPFIAWLYYLGQPFENFLNLVRLPSLILSHGTLWFWMKISAPLLERKKLIWLFYLLLFMPFVGPASLIATPDLPMLFFWSAGLYHIIKISEGDNSLSRFTLLGLCLGLGFSSKYTMVLIAPMFFVGLFHLGIKQFFGRFRNLISLILFFIVGSFPVFWWNFSNNFESFKFQVNHGVGAQNWNPDWTLTYLLAQIALIFPVVLYYSFKNQSNHLRVKILKWAAWIPIIFFFFTSFKGRVEANWPIMAHPAFLVIAMGFPNVRKKWLQLTLIFWSAIFCIIYFNFFANVLPFEKLKESKEFDSIIPYTLKYQPIYARTFQMAAQLSFKTKQPIYKLKGMNRVDFYDRRKESVPSDPVFYVITLPEDRLPEEWALKGYKVTENIYVNEQYSLWKVEQ